jgi:type III restriction enzyme
MSAVGEDRAELNVLATFQHEAVDALSATIRRVASHIDDHLDDRRKIALRSGAMLLQAPTGSGKTLMLGRTIEGLIGTLPMKTIWFWFAPYAGLVTQTTDALAEQCPGIRLRDLTKDRESTGARDGDCFIQTWAAVAANNADAKRVRRESEGAHSLDQMLVTLRASGFAIGVVIDEAHLHFGASAAVAANFYLDILQPDFTLLATATPNDDKLAAFEKAAGVEVESRVVIDRDRVVLAGLNKFGLMLGYLNVSAEQAKLIDFEQAMLNCGWTQHLKVREALAARDIDVAPLMLVQVEDQAAGGEDPVKRVREKLIENGVPDSMIAVHTSGQPDAEFHMLAYDHSKQVLIFKVAVATGFDAPRAWTLVSVRPNRGKDFGIQIVGRIMRVHKAVRPTHGKDMILDRGYVFLTDPDMQIGLNAAVDELKAVRQSIAVLSDKLDIVEYGTAIAPKAFNDAHRLSAYAAQPPSTDAERQERLTLLIDDGIVPASVADMDAATIDQAISLGETVRDQSQTPLFGNLPEQDTPGLARVAPATKLKAYPLRADLGIPRALYQEVPLSPAELDSPDFVNEIAAEFCNRSQLLSQLHKTRQSASMSLRDLFLEGEEREVSLSLRLSSVRIAEQAQAAFQFNDSIDPRKLQLALIENLRGRAEGEGIEFSEQDLRRTVFMAAMQEPGALKVAMKLALGKRVQVTADQPIPTEWLDTDDVKPSLKSAHGIFPTRMNNPEREFAEFLDADTTGTVKWWLRNPESVSWATRLILPTGRRFFPDFAVGIHNRTTPDGIALVEIKDDGEDGRLHSDLNTIKIQVQHREYRNVFWSYSGDKGFVRAVYSEGLDKIIPKDVFRIADMVYVTS